MTRLLYLILGLALLTPTLRAQTVAVVDQYPWGSYNENGRPTGIQVELIQQLVVRSGLPLQIRLVALQRIAEEAEKGGFDLTLMPRPNAIKNRLEPIATLYSGPMIAIGAPGVRLTTEKDLETLSPIGTLRTLIYGSSYENNPRIERIPENTIEGALRKLQAGRLTAFIASEASIRLVARHMKLPLDDFPVLNVGYWDITLTGRPGFAASKDGKDLQEAAESMIRDRYTEELIRLRLASPLQN